MSKFTPDSRTSLNISLYCALNFLQLPLRNFVSFSGGGVWGYVFHGVEGHFQLICKTSNTAVSSANLGNIY